MPNPKGTATNREGLGSTYAGTQTPDNNDPDAYQKPAANAEGQDENSLPEGKLGAEYQSEDSYGKKGNETLKEGSADGTGETNGPAEGNPIR